MSPAVFKTVEGGVPALVSSILTCPRQSARAQLSAGVLFCRNRFQLLQQVLGVPTVVPVLLKPHVQLAHMKASLAKSMTPLQDKMQDKMLPRALVPWGVLLCV